MTLAGILIFDGACLVVVLWVLDLVRRGRLYVGYAVVFVMLVVTSAIGLTVAPVRAAVVTGLSTLFPGNGPVVVALAALVLLLLYVLMQITIISNRLARLVQELAIREARDGTGAEGAERPTSGEQ